jgi:hypothetical protein
VLDRSRLPERSPSVRHSIGGERRNLRPASNRIAGLEQLTRMGYGRHICVRIHRPAKLEEAPVARARRRKSLATQWGRDRATLGLLHVNMVEIKVGETQTVRPVQVRARDILRPRLLRGSLR